MFTFQNLDRDTYKILRTNIIDMILATEMTKHFEHLARFMNVCSLRIGEDQPMEVTSNLFSNSFSCTNEISFFFSFFQYNTENVDVTILLQPDNVMMVKRMMIKCADVSNPTRPLRSCIEWARRIAEEYFNQVRAVLEFLI